MHRRPRHVLLFVTDAHSTIMFPLLFLSVNIERCRLSQRKRCSVPAFIYCLYAAIESALFVNDREVERRG